VSIQVVSPGFDPFWPGGDVGVGLRELFGPQILGRYLLHGPQLVTDASYLESPNDFSADPPWSSVLLTWPGPNTCREVANTQAHNWRQELAGRISVGPFSWGIDLQDDGCRFARIHSYDGSGYHYYMVDLQTGSTSGVLACTPDVTNLGGGLWRCRMLDTVCVDPATAYVRVYLSQDGTNLVYLGDITKGLKAYNATIDQTSILTAPNDPILAARNLALYGDPLHFTNPTKESQLVVGDDVWDGLPGAIASDANFLTCDPMAARYSGTNKPIGMVAPIQGNGVGASDYLLSLGNSGTDTPWQTVRTNASNKWATVKKDNSGAPAATNDSNTAPGTDRIILAWNNTGAAESLWVNGVATSILNSACSVGACTFNRLTFSALRRTTVAGYVPIIAREFLLFMSASNAQALAASNLMRAGNPI
jgi:hypothetical protein